MEFLECIRDFSSRRSVSSRSSSKSTGEVALEGDNGELDPMGIAEDWGIQKTMWNREWSTLSGGEGQRIALAIAIGVGGAEVVLLDGKCSPPVQVNILGDTGVAADGQNLRALWTQRRCRKSKRPFLGSCLDVDIGA
jgi:hypothetical protein